jgi:phosphoribosylglycinamide formyltransferase-1
MRIVILGSGRGTNCEALINAQKSGALASVEIVGVLSDQKDSGILKIAQDLEIHQIYLGPYNAAIRSDDKRWIEAVKEYKPDLLVLAGFMRILSEDFIKAFNAQIINIHPSLLPSFRGRNAIKQAWDEGVKITGCTVHWVTPDLDSGKIIAQAPVRIMPSDTLESVTAKVHAVEHMLLPSVVAELSHKTE